MQFKKFKSPTDSDLRVVDTSGHVVTLTPEYSSVPDVLWAAAYSLGAISEDMNVNDMDSFISQKKKEMEEALLKEREELKEVLRKVAKEPVGYVDKEGKPIARKVIGLMEKPVKKDLIDSVWDELVKEGI